MLPISVQYSPIAHTRVDMIT
ncbi:hypothetical protein Golob_020726 [Gossypium lobatum]|uniref:Uncharacterized protein n=1 Tax=Gossypium lobatum TaxID=34289 RepID=A0A7J8LBG0_9ROSI|nr:hypothetical protein [Gossypium lobatum]